MKSLAHLKWAFVPLLSIFLCAFTASTVSGQVLLQENFDAAPLGAPPPGWTQFGDGNVDPGQSCLGNSFRMNLFGNNTISNLTSPTINRGNVPGKVMISFDYRLADWNNNNQLTGDGNVGLGINNGSQFPWNQSVSFTNGCQKQSFSFTTAEVPLNSDFTFTFIADWTSGDWAFILDNIRVWILNDECETAVLIPQTDAPSGVTDQPTSGSYFAATQSLPNCDGFANNDVWYEFIATEEAVSIAVIGQDIAAGLYAGSCGSLTSLACQGVMLGNVFFDYYGTTVGETYYVRVHSYTEGAASVDEGEFQIQIGTPLVINDECAAAITLPQTTAPAGILTGAVTDGSFEFATQSQPGCAGTANDDVWYEFVATERAVSVSVEGGDVVWELFSGTCGSLTSLECKNGSSVNEFGDYYGTIIGETYYLRVYTFDATPLSGTDADFRIQIGTPRSINNECVSAEIITQSAATTCGTNFTMGTVENATESQAACTGTANDDVWYEFVATSTDFSVYLESGDFVVELFEGSCGSLVALDCEDGLGVNETFDYSGATVGATYFLRIHSFGSTALTGTAADFGLCVFTTPPAPANDDCANAETLFPSVNDNCGGLTSGTTNGATRSEPDPRCSGINGRESVWYSFTATDTEHFVTLSDVDILNRSSNDISSFEVFSGNCGARTRIQCSGQLNGSNPGTVSVSGLTVGETYLIRVIPVNPFHTIDFDICITSPCPDLPTDLQVGNLTTTTADLSHNYEFTVSRTFAVVLPGDDPVNDAVFSETTLQGNTTATGLQPATDYEYYVLTDCGGLEITGPVEFTTCVLLATGLGVTDIAITTATLNIDDDGGLERDFIVVAAGDVPVFGDNSNHVFFSTSSANSIMASGLSPNTAYDFYVGQACPNTFTGPVSFTTLAATFCGTTIYDDGGIAAPYSNNLDQVITLCPQDGSGDKLSIRFTAFDFEDNGSTGCFDGITIYDGPDTDAPIISSPSGTTDMWCWNRAVGVGSGDLLNTLIFNNNPSGCFTLRIQSDATVVGGGFAIEVICGSNNAFVFETIAAVPTGAGSVTADRAILNAESGYTYFIDDNEGGGVLLGLNLGNSAAIVPISGVSIQANNTTSNLGLNGCVALYTNLEDWWVSGRTWDVAATLQPNSPVGVSFPYTNTDFNGLASSSGFAGITHQSLTHYKINGGDEEDLTVPGNACHDLVNPANYQEFDPGEYFYLDPDGPGLENNAAFYTVDEFSGGGFGVGTNFMGSLPIELISFTGEVQEHNNRLEWISAQEENTEIHLIERSADGRSWQAIGQLAAAGNSQEVLSYEFIDHAPLSRAFYRIQTIDLDRSSSTSAILELNRRKEGTLQLGYPAPSPTTGPFFIDISPATSSQIIDLRILEASGQLRQQQQLEISEGGSQLTFDLSELPAGLYWLVVTDERGERKSRPVFKR